MGLGDRQGILNARFVLVRIDVRVGEDAGDRNVAAAELFGDIPVEIFGGDDRNHPCSGGC